MGEASYNYLLKHVLLLPFDAHDVAHLGEVELAPLSPSRRCSGIRAWRHRSVARETRAEGRGGVSLRRTRRV